MATSVFSPFVPNEYADHPLVKGRLFFTLPEQLLAQVLQEVGQARFSADLLPLERAMSKVCGDHTHTVGSWGTQPIWYTLLRREPLRLNEEERAWLRTQYPTLRGFSEELANSRIDPCIDVARGYCGWLLLNPDFHQEHLELFQTWGDEVSQFGLPQGELVVPDRNSLPDMFQPVQGRGADFGRAFDDFFIRWRLSHLSAPYLPMPLMPQLPVMNLRSVLGHMRHGGATFYMPDTFPVPSRDELRVILEDVAARESAPAHLRDWQEMVAGSNTGKSTISRYARLFELQHFWRVLQQRHSNALHRATGKLEQAFASFFGTGRDTIHKDLGLIASKLGDDWATSD